MDEFVFYSSMVVFCILLLVIIFSPYTYNYYYVDVYGEENKADYCENSGGHLLCTDFTTGERFLVNSYRFEPKEK